ncbi:MAG: hypothetical protein AO396_09330 [Candidatus Fermentibacter daniensis]|nr:MAG: hypothetical protein AO395_02265 [Candidatus Fermentibacter daniensis]KZD19363.1 MAG: hypothetical protein AO396_09330 [Candidatus Fermentibacter daniensis]
MVVFPFEPVTARIGAWANRNASSISPVTGIPASTAACGRGDERGMPGLRTRPSSPSIMSATGFPRLTSEHHSQGGTAGLSSKPLTEKPLVASSLAAARPLRPRPATPIFLPPPLVQ